MKTTLDIIMMMGKSPPSKWAESDIKEAGQVLTEAIYKQKPKDRFHLSEILDGKSVQLPQPTDLCSQSFAARCLGVSTKTVNRMIKDGKIPLANIETKTPRIPGAVIRNLVLTNREQHENQH